MTLSSEARPGSAPITTTSTQRSLPPPTLLAQAHRRPAQADDPVVAHRPLQTRRPQRNQRRPPIYELRNREEWIEAPRIHSGDGFAKGIIGIDGNPVPIGTLMPLGQGRLFGQAVTIPSLMTTICRTNSSAPSSTRPASPENRPLPGVDAGRHPCQLATRRRLPSLFTASTGAAWPQTRLHPRPRQDPRHRPRRAALAKLDILETGAKRFSFASVLPLTLPLCTAAICRIEPPPQPITQETRLRTMNDRPARQPARPTNLLLATLIVLTMPLARAQFATATPAPAATSPDKPTPAPVFDVASIRQNVSSTDNHYHVYSSPNDGNLRAINITVKAHAQLRICNAGDANRRRDQPGLIRTSSTSRRRPIPPSVTG